MLKFLEDNAVSLNSGIGLLRADSQRQRSRRVTMATFRFCCVTCLSYAAGTSVSVLQDHPLQELNLSGVVKVVRNDA